MAKKEINKDKAKPSQTPAVFSPFEEMEQWFNGFPHQSMHPSFMHPFRNDWPACSDLETYKNGRFPNTDIVEKDNKIM